MDSFCSKLKIIAILIVGLSVAGLLAADGGLNVLKELGQPPFEPCRVTTTAAKDALPGGLAKLVEVRE